jgi:RNase H-like domain found in reverse transcriptase/Integrase zinc binding domain
LNWPVPKSSTDVRAFLGLVRYVSVFLPKLAEHTCILTPLTTKECCKTFPAWTTDHQTAFDAVKALVVSANCLTVIDHENPGENKIFVTCDASDWRTGATLSFGPTWETAHPVAFDSMQLRSAEKNYPVHEKELLAIIRALKKWHSDLLGTHFYVYTDHRMLENFDTQKDLSRRQLRWQEFLSQYDLTINYIRGEDNTVADALSRLPPNCFSDESLETTNSVNAVLTITSDEDILNGIKAGYHDDEFCKRVASSNMKGWTLSNGLWYIGDRLLIPCVGTIRETLFHLAHDTLGHFGADKSYASLRDAYYWPNMRRDLEQAYIPACPDCLRNKSRTTRPPGLLHPLPVPDARGSSIAMDFVGPLPLDDNFDCILSITDRLGSDVRIVPTKSDINAEDLALVFFNTWYCENGLPSNIVCDRDKLFVSKFWKVLTKLTGVKLKMSSAYHPETDGSSERSNKTINQMLRYHVTQNQRGWVRALPRIRFQIMNTVNASTGFSGFQLHLGRSPRVIPPIIPDSLLNELQEAALTATTIIQQLENDVAQARDNLLLAKITQSHHASANHAPDPEFKINDLVMLSTANRRHEYKKKGEKRTVKFFPRWDGPFRVTASHPEASTYMLDIPTNQFPTYHTSELKPHHANDGSLFPSCELTQPGPILTTNGLEEYLVDNIIDSRRCGHCIAVDNFLPLEFPVQTNTDRSF